MEKKRNADEQVIRCHARAYDGLFTLLTPEWKESFADSYFSNLQSF